MKTTFKTRKEEGYNINSQQQEGYGCQADYCCIKGIVSGKRIADEKMEIDVDTEFFDKHYHGNKSAGKCPKTECSCFDDLNSNLSYTIMHTLYVLRKRIEELEQKDDEDDSAFSLAPSIYRIKGRNVNFC